MRTGKQNMYGITIQCTTTQQTEYNKVFLFSREYKRMLNRINEIVYTDDNKKEWSLIKIEKL